MTGITITEALAEIKTIGKRITKKREGLGQYLARAEGVKDPLEKTGGSEKFIASELQAVGDLENRTIQLRRAIQSANDSTLVTVNGTSRTISEWLVWRRDVAPGQKSFLEKIRATLTGMREDAKRRGVKVSVGSVTKDEELQPSDIVVNIDESQIAKSLDQLEDTLGTLDGQLSLKNATVTLDTFIEVAQPAPLSV